MAYIPEYHEKLQNARKTGPSLPCHVKFPANRIWSYGDQGAILAGNGDEVIGDHNHGANTVSGQGRGALAESHRQGATQ